MRIERKRIAELIPAPYNPRKDIQPYDEEYEKLYPTEEEVLEQEKLNKK